MRECIRIRTEKHSVTGCIIVLVQFNNKSNAGNILQEFDIQLNVL